MRFFAFAASHRKESFNRKLAWLAAAAARANGEDVDFAEYSELDLPMYNNDRGKNDPLPPALLKASDRIRQADGLIIATPEYSWSMPGSLKNIIDWISVADDNMLAGKTAFLLSASPSFKGGVLAAMHLQLPLQSIGAAVYPRMHTLGLARQAFDGGVLKEPKQMQLLESMVKGYIEFTRALTSNR